DEAALPTDLCGVVVVGLGILDRMPAQALAGPVVILVGDDSFAFGIGRGIDLIGDDLQAVGRQVEEAEYLRAQQRADIGAGGIGEAGIDLLGHRRAADFLVALEHQDLELALAALLAAHGEIGRGGEAVMPATDHDRVVELRHGPPSRPESKLNEYSIIEYSFKIYPPDLRLSSRRPQGGSRFAV